MLPYVILFLLSVSRSFSSPIANTSIARLDLFACNPIASLASVAAFHYHGRTDALKYHDTCSNGQSVAEYFFSLVRANVTDANDAIGVMGSFNGRTSFPTFPFFANLYYVILSNFNVDNADLNVVYPDVSYALLNHATYLLLKEVADHVDRFVLRLLTRNATFRPYSTSTENYMNARFDGVLRGSYLEDLNFDRRQEDGTVESEYS